jgi:hypothetical protein
VSKGSSRRREDAEKVRANWDLIFSGKQPEQKSDGTLLERLRERNSNWLGECPAVYEEAADFIEEVLK